MNVVKIKQFYKEHKKEIALGILGIGVGIICGGKIYRILNQKPHAVSGLDDSDHIANYIDLLQYGIKHDANGVYRGYLAPVNYTISDLGSVGKDLCSARTDVSINDKLIGVSLITKGS